MARPPSTIPSRLVAEAPTRPGGEHTATRGTNQAVADRLHEAVRAAGGNQAVALRSGVPLATVNNYVRGRNGMKIESLSALAAACNVSLQWLVSGDAAAGPDFPAADAVRPPGLSEPAPMEIPGEITGGVDLRILTKAIEVVAALAKMADFEHDPKGLARRIAATYAVLMKPEAPRD
jgi:transcriptional regulator with XRE-family HTH domain